MDSKAPGKGKYCRGENRAFIISLLPHTVKKHNGNVVIACSELATMYGVSPDFVAHLWKERCQTIGTQTTTTTAFMSSHPPPSVNQMNFHGLSQGQIQPFQPSVPAMQHFPLFHNIQCNPSNQSFAPQGNLGALMDSRASWSPTFSATGLSEVSPSEVMDSLSVDFTNLVLEVPPSIKEGTINFDEIKHGNTFLELVNSEPFWAMLTNYNEKHRKDGCRGVSSIGGGSKEIVIFSHPDVLRKKYQNDGSSLLQVPVSLSDFAKPSQKLKSWTADTNTEFWIEFTNKWEEENKDEEIVSLLLLCSDGLHPSAQDIHIDVGKGGGQFTLSVSREKILKTVAYPNQLNCFSNGGLHNCLSFLSEWNIEEECIQLLKEKIKTLFRSIESDSKLLEEGWNKQLWSNTCGALLHEYKERENKGEYETGQYLSMSGPIPHRAPTITPPDTSQGTGQRRPILFGVTRKKGSDYVYDYDDQITAPELIAMLLETLWPCLEPHSVPNRKAKSSLLFLFVSSLYRSNDLQTEWNRFVTQNDFNDYECSIAVIEKLLEHPGVMKSERTNVIAASNDRLVSTLDDELLDICNKICNAVCNEEKNAMSTDEE